MSEVDGSHVCEAKRQRSLTRDNSAVPVVNYQESALSPTTWPKKNVSSQGCAIALAGGIYPTCVEMAAALRYTLKSRAGARG